MYSGKSEVLLNICCWRTVTVMMANYGPQATSEFCVAQVVNMKNTSKTASGSISVLYFDEINQ